MNVSYIYLCMHGLPRITSFSFLSMGNYLAAPDKKKHEPADGQGGSVAYGACGMQGWRNTMEDAHLALINISGSTDESNGSPSNRPSYSLFAVFDGHGGISSVKNRR